MNMPVSRTCIYYTCVLPFAFCLARTLPLNESAPLATPVEYGPSINELPWGFPTPRLRKEPRPKPLALGWRYAPNKEDRYGECLAKGLRGGIFYKAHKKSKAPRDLEAFAVRTGLEPATPCVTGTYSNRLNYRTV